MCVRMYTRRALSLFVSMYTQRGISFCFYVTQSENVVCIHVHKEKFVFVSMYTQRSLCIYVHTEKEMCVLCVSQWMCVCGCVRASTQEVFLCFYAHAQRRNCACACTHREKSFYLCTRREKELCVVCLSRWMCVCARKYAQREVLLCVYVHPLRSLSHCLHAHTEGRSCVCACARAH